jgi:hypothetical protein
VVTSNRCSSSQSASHLIFRDARLRRAPQDEVLDPHGEERGNAARLEPRGHGTRGHPSRRAQERAPQDEDYKGRIA